MNYFIKLYGTRQDPQKTWNGEGSKALTIADVSDWSKGRAQKVKKGDGFVIYCVPRRFMGLQIVTKELELKRFEGRFPHVIEVFPYLVIPDFDHAIPIGEVRKWENKSKDLENALAANMQGGLFRIQETDFARFEREFQKRLQDMGLWRATMNL